MATKTKSKPKLTKLDRKPINRKAYADIKASEPSTAAELVVTQPDKVGRPTDYTIELAAKICASISQGDSIRTALAPDELPAISTFYVWLAKHSQFAEQYTRACQERAEAMAEDILDIADDGSNDWMERKYGDQIEWVTNGEALQRSKLRVETRKFLMSKMKPKKYGERLDITSGGDALPTPLIYIPTELPYTAINNKRRVIDGNSTDEPAPTTEGQTTQ